MAGCFEFLLRHLKGRAALWHIFVVVGRRCLVGAKPGEARRAAGCGAPQPYHSNRIPW